MNLYKIMFEHYAPRDSEKGIITYLAAKSDEEVYEWLKSDPELTDRERIFTPYRDNEKDDTKYEIFDKDYNVIGEESYKDRVIRLNGDMFDDEVELNDLYYGKTLYGWKLVRESISEDDIQTLKDLGINLESIN